MNTSAFVKIAVVIPCYRVCDQILGVLGAIGPEVERIYVVDDACPENTSQLVKHHCTDPRVHILKNETNLGVGGAVLRGYRQALQDDMEIVIKLDGDGQMDPGLIENFITPLLEKRADYTKGNRFYSLDALNSMPRLRMFGNSVVSFFSKFSSGYWNLMDPVNGYTAIHRRALEMLPLEKIDRGYFFESDMLFRLNTIRAVVEEIPMDSQYANEISSLNISKVSREFPLKYTKRFFKRIFYNYFLRDFNVCSLQIILGLLLTLWGVLFGGYHWYSGFRSGVFASSGTVMLSAMPFILGFQLLIAAVSFDVNNIPRNPLSRLLKLRHPLPNQINPVSN